MVSGVSWIVSTAVVTGSASASRRLGVSCSASTDKMHELDRITGRDFDVGESRPAHDTAIVLDHDGPRIERQLSQHFQQRRTVSDLLELAIYHNVHQLFHATHSSRMRRTVCAGSASSQKALIAAIPYAPLVLRSRTRFTVMPPMAMTGTSPAAAAILRNCSSPSGFRDGWDAVTYTGPTTR